MLFQSQEAGNLKALQEGQAILENQQLLSSDEKERLLGYLEGKGRVILPEPAPLLTKTSVFPGLDGRKMSKSYNNTIELFASQADTRKAIMRIVTDSKTVAESKDPATCNVFALYKLFATGQEREAMAARYRAGGLGYGEVKQALFDKFWTAFEPFRHRREELQKNPERVEQILQHGAARAREELHKTLKTARRAVGLE